MVKKGHVVLDAGGPSAILRVLFFSLRITDTYLYAHATVRNLRNKKTRPFFFSRIERTIFDLRYLRFEVRGIRNKLLVDRFLASPRAFANRYTRITPPSLISQRDRKALVAPHCVNGHGTQRVVLQKRVRGAWASRRVRSSRSMHALALYPAAKLAVSRCCTRVANERGSREEREGRRGNSHRATYLPILA